MTTQGYKGRGAISAPAGRFAQRDVEIDAGVDAQSAAPTTTLRGVRAGRIVSSNRSPDVPFERSINPYQGCEHGCVYCYARPSHSYLDLSPGLDFETQIFYKPNAAAQLLEEWQKPGYACKPIAIGANTDPYQPAEKSLRITRQLLELFVTYRHPVMLITKSHLVTRDIDLLSDLAADGLCSIAISIPTMDDGLKRIMEPRVPAATARLNAIKQLTRAGVPVSLLLAPLIPAVNDAEIETILESAADAGALRARYVFLRLPHELKGLFVEWLETHFPERAGHVMNLIREAGGGRDYDNRFGIRQRGRGAYAEMLRQRFDTAAKRFGIDPRGYHQSLDCKGFLHPAKRQQSLDF